MKYWFAYHANLDGMIVGCEERTRSVCQCCNTVWCPDLIGYNGADMTHSFLTSSHLKYFDSRVIADLGCIDEVVVRSNWRSLVDEVELDSAIVQNMGVKAEEIQVFASSSTSIITSGFNGAEIEKAVCAGAIDVQGKQLGTTRSTSGRVYLLHAIKYQPSYATYH